MLAQKTRNAHWNVSGINFLELYQLYEKQYNQLNKAIDRIAERVRMLGGYALASFGESLSRSVLEEQHATVPDLLQLLADHESVIRYLREDIRKCKEEYEDEGTAELMVSIMSLHEKIAWVLRSYVENEQIQGESQKKVV